MASGDTLLLLQPGGAELPTSNMPTFDKRNGNLVLDFDDTTDESCELGGFMPRHYGGGGITVTIGWMATSATSGNCIWALAFKSVSDDADDLDTKAFAAANSVTDAAASASGEVAYATVTFTDGADMDSVAAGEYFRLQVTRDADNASDTMVGDAELLFIEIKET
jgi:hypothetical protein